MKKTNLETSQCEFLMNRFLKILKSNPDCCGEVELLLYRAAFARSISLFKPHSLSKHLPCLKRHNKNYQIRIYLAVFPGQSSHLTLLNHSPAGRI